MTNKSIAIIGANSFIATNLINELVNYSYQLQLYGRKEVYPNESSKFTFFDYPHNPINFEELLAFDVIIYTAGAGTQQTIPTTNELIYQLNAFVPISLVQYLEDKEYKGHVITFGSYFEIGNTLVKKYHTEEDYISNNNPLPNNYCISKRLLSAYVNQKIDRTGFLFTHFVLPNVYGVGENCNRIIPYVVENIKMKKPISLSNGTQVRQFLHVKDVARAVQKTIDQPKSGIYNIANRDVLSIRELVQLIIGETTSSESLDIKFGNVTHKDVFMQFLALNVDKVESDLNWTASVSLRDGIQEYFK
jgi:nucleoside-diphosphate-sugar epimerase